MTPINPDSTAPLSTPSPARRFPARRFPWIAWTLSATLTASCSAWLGASSWYAVDLLAQFTAQAVGLAGLFALLWAAMRRWAPAGLCAAAAALGLWPLVQGRSLTIEAPSRPGAPSLKILTYNALAINNADPEAVRAVIREADADVAAIFEAPGWLIEELKAGGEWRERYPFYWLPKNAGGGFWVLLSRHPQRSAADPSHGLHRTGGPTGREVIIDGPTGPFMFVMFHPQSPRSPARWRLGNQIARAVGGRRPERPLAVGLPLLGAADMNSTPTGGRSLEMHSRDGLRRAKPLLIPEGTFPAWSPWPFSLAIDDVVVEEGVRVVGWRTLGAAGSDHRPVLVEVELAAQP